MKNDQWFDNDIILTPCFGHNSPSIRQLARFGSLLNPKMSVNSMGCILVHIVLFHKGITQSLYFYYRKGGNYALDDFRGSPGSLGVGAGERLYDWRIHSYSACHRSRCGVDQDHSGTKTYINDLLM
jgi:hypothetical protein